jgi:hypothetical protein
MHRFPISKKEDHFFAIHSYDSDRNGHIFFVEMTNSVIRFSKPHKIGPSRPKNHFFLTTNTFPIATREETWHYCAPGNGTTTDAIRHFRRGLTSHKATLTKWIILKK